MSKKFVYIRKKQYFCGLFLAEHDYYCVIFVKKHVININPGHEFA